MTITRDVIIDTDKVSKGSFKMSVEKAHELFHSRPKTQEQ